jgi:hypothetical protein
MNMINQVLHDIIDERARQEKLKASGKFHWTLADDRVHEDKLAVLAEEFGEVAKNVVDFTIFKDGYARENEPFPLHRTRFYLQIIRTELIQVAACCVAWCENIDKLLENIEAETKKAEKK